jgi:hypothetical protein
MQNAHPRSPHAGQSLIGLLLLGILTAALPGECRAGFYTGDPSNYGSRLAALQPGDTLQLLAGTYTRLVVHNMEGRADAWIVIRGTGTPSQTVIQGEPGYNTVQLDGASYIAIENLRIDGLGHDVDGVNAKGVECHDIRIEGCTLVNFWNNQATVGISTKVTVWNWTIRNNAILDAGTGIYLGDSDGSCPFINGLIEGNYIKHTIGYNMEIKQQIPYSLLPGMPPGPNRTIIRNNVFMKDDTQPDAGARPNLLVDPFPDSGPGSQDMYEIYGNFFYYNPLESLFQGTGRMTIHDNVFVAPGAGNAALYLTDHNGPLQYVTVYNNTIYGSPDGIAFVDQPRAYALVVGNLIFSDRPIYTCGGCTLDVERDNVTDSVASADQYVNQPSTVLGAMDFYPRSDCTTCAGASLDLSAVAGDRDYAFDFNGTSKGSFLYRGAYAGSGANPGWPLQDGPKIGGPSSGGGGLVDTTPPSAPIGLRVR